MPHVMCIAGIDPSGGAGLSADMRAAAFVGAECLPIASVLTVQNSREFSELEYVSKALIEKQVRAAMEEHKPGAVKVGLLGNPETVNLVAGIFDNIPLVVDPVLRTSSGYALADDGIVKAYMESLFPVADIITPNAHEASVLTGIEVFDIETAKEACLVLMKTGTKTVIVKGGHFTTSKGSDVFHDGQDFHILDGEQTDADPRGTGCTFSTLIAGYLAYGHNSLEAVKHAKSDMNRILSMSPNRILSGADGLDDERKNVWLAVNRAASELVNIFPPRFIAEVGNNLAYAITGAEGPGDVCSLDSRLIKKGERVVTQGTPVFGRHSHVGRIVLAAIKHFPECRCAMNIRYSEGTLDIARKIDMKVEGFDRKDQPLDESSMEWGTLKVLGEHGLVDLIFDKGSVGKEPMIRLLANDPENLICKLTKLLGSGT